MWRRDGGQTPVINDIICNGLMEQDGEEEAKNARRSPILDATRMQASIKMHVNRFAPIASSGRNA